MLDEPNIDGISIVTTTFNEKEYIRPFIKRIRNVLGNANYEVIIIDDFSPEDTYEEASNLENPPELIPRLLRMFSERNFDLLVASRIILPSVSERFTSETIGKIVGIGDVYSNFRVYRCDLFKDYEPLLGETFGDELLVHAWTKGYRIGEYIYEPPH